MSYSKYAGAASLLAFLPMVLTAQVATRVDVPLKNWATPLYWQPNQAETRASGKAQPQLQFSTNQVSTDALTFIAISPCRLIDTRGAGGGFNGISPFSGPSIVAATTVTFPVQSATEASTDTTPAPCGVIPSIAQAYSLNVTVVPHSGGAVDYISMWPAGGTQPFVATLNDPQGAIAGNAAIVPAGTPSGGVSIYNSGPATTDVIIDMNGFFAAPSDLNNNTAIGRAALASDTTGFNNLAVGTGALSSNTTGCCNTATGIAALDANTTGAGNTANGAGAMIINTTGSQNTAVGQQAMFDNTTGNANTAIGQSALHDNTTGSNNTASGQAAMFSNTTGSFDTASGFQALYANTTGSYNSSFGYQSLQANTTGQGNAASGWLALWQNTTGDNNTASGAGALQFNTTGGVNSALGNGALGANIGGSANTASGAGAMQDNTTGSNDTAAGYQALMNNTTGGNNIAIGNNAAYNVSPGNSNNIHIGSQGVSGDSATIRIGTLGTQTSFFAAGISGVTTGLSGAVNVVVDANGQLGTISSSARFKEDIHDMGDASSGLLKLRPVTFRYRQPYADGSKPLDYGLIAEEVAQVYPDLAVKDASGQIQTVQYQKLTPMLLNELQKQSARVETLEEQNRKLEERLAALETLLSSQTTRPTSSQ